MIQTDRYLRTEAEHAEALEEMRDHREDFVRAYLRAVDLRLEQLAAEVEEAMLRLGPGPGNPDHYAGDAEAALPTLDDILHGDRVGEFTGRELAAMGRYDADAISEVASELMGKAFKV